MAKFVCSVCGYVYEGDAAPEKCPVCNAPASKFNKQEGELTWAADSGVSYSYLPQGDYYYGFTIDDVYGDFLVTDPVVFSIDASGNIKFKVQAE